MNRLIRMCLVLFAISMLLQGCKRRGNEGVAFTLETGLDVEIGICTGDQAPSVSIKELGSSQIVDLIWDFPCGAEIDKPYLTVVRNDGATLVLNSDYGKNACSCPRKMAIKINKRLKNGETLYLVINKEVIAHKLLVASQAR